MSGYEISTPYMIMKMAIGLGVVIVLMLGLIWLIRYLQSKKGLLPGIADRVRIQQTMNLGGRNRLYVLRWQGQDYLVGFGQAGGFLVDKKEVVCDDNKSQKPNVTKKT